MPIVDSTFLAGPRVQPIIRRGQGAGGGRGDRLLRSRAARSFIKKRKSICPQLDIDRDPSIARFTTIGARRFDDPSRPRRLDISRARAQRTFTRDRGSAISPTR